MFSRRGSRFNRRRIGAGGGALYSSPLQGVTGLLLLVDTNTNTVLDKSGQGNVPTVQGSAGTFGATFNGRTVLTMTTGKALTYAGPVVTHRVGADKPFTIVLIYRPATVGAAQNLAGWALSSGGASDRGHHLRAATTTRDHQCLLRDDAALTTTITDTDNTWFHEPQLIVFRYSGTAGFFDLNGATGGSIAQDRGTLTPDNFSVWCFNALSGLNATGNGELAILAVYDHNLSAAELDIVTALAYSMGISVADIPAVTQVTGFGIGQSNMRGPAGSITGTAGVRGMNLDGFIRDAPTTLNDGGASDTIFTTLHNETGQHKSLMLMVGESLVTTEGYPQVGICSMAKGGTTAIEWAVDAATTTLYGAAINFINRVLRQTGTTCDFIVVSQGEEEADDAVNAPLWAGRWDAIADALQTAYPGVILVFVELSATNPNPAVYTEWDVVRAQQELMADAPNDRYVVQAPDLSAAPDVHYTEAELRTLGADIAAQLQAAGL